MADWEHKPTAGTYRIVRLDPPTLVDRFEDNVPVIRQKSSTTKNEYIGEFHVTDGVAKTMLDFFDTKLLSTSFTILSFDPASATPSTVTATVYFASRADSRYMGPTRHLFTWHFIGV